MSACTHFTLSSSLKCPHEHTHEGQINKHMRTQTEIPLWVFICKKLGKQEANAQTRAGRPLLQLAHFELSVDQINKRFPNTTGLSQGNIYRLRKKTCKATAGIKSAQTNPLINLGCQKIAHRNTYLVWARGPRWLRERDPDLCVTFTLSFRVTVTSTGSPC